MQISPLFLPLPHSSKQTNTQNFVFCSQVAVYHCLVWLVVSQYSSKLHSRYHGDCLYVFGFVFQKVHPLSRWSLVTGFVMFRPVAMTLHTQLVFVLLVCLFRPVAMSLYTHTQLVFGFVCCVSLPWYSRTLFVFCLLSADQSWLGAKSRGTRLFRLSHTYAIITNTYSY